MVNLFKSDNETRKKHKKQLLSLGGAKFPKKLAQKLLAMAVCTAMVLLGVPLTGGSYVARAAEHSNVDITLSLIKNQDGDLELDGIDRLRAWQYETANVTFANHTGEPDECVRLELSTYAHSIYVRDQITVSADPETIAVAWINDRWQAFHTDTAILLDINQGSPMNWFSNPQGPKGNTERGFTVWTDGLHGNVTSVYFPTDRMMNKREVHATRSKYNPKVWHFSRGDLSRVKAFEFMYFRYSDYFDTPRQTQSLLRWPSGDQEGLSPPQAFIDDEFNDVPPQFIKVNGVWQDIHVIDHRMVLPYGVKFSARIVNRHEGMDDIDDIEHRFCYELTLKDEDNQPVLMPLSHPIELWFQVVDGLDANDIDVLLVNTLGEDHKFEVRNEHSIGRDWVVVTTDHLSPYALVDKLNESEKSERDAGVAAISCAAGLSALALLLVSALGVVLDKVTRRRFYL